MYGCLVGVPECYVGYKVSAKGMNGKLGQFDGVVGRSGHRWRNGSESGSSSSRGDSGSVPNVLRCDSFLKFDDHHMKSSLVLVTHASEV